MRATTSDRLAAVEGDVNEETFMRLPTTDLGVVFRTDFSSRAGWDAVRARLVEGHAEEHGGLGEDVPQLLFVEDEEFDGLTAGQASQMIEEADDVDHPVVFLADSATMNRADRAVLVVATTEDVDEGLEWSFRLRPESVARVRLMLASGRMSFSEYLDDVDENGLYEY